MGALSPTKQELREAERFIRKHGIGSMPGRRFENGETADVQRSDWLGGADRIAGADGQGGGSRSRIVSYDRTGVGVWEEWMVEQGLNYNPLVGQSVTLSLTQLEKQARTAHVLSFLREDRVALLYQRHVEGRTEAAIAADLGITQQAVSKRLKVAEQDFRAAYGEHWYDDVDLDLDEVEQEGADDA